MRSFPLFVPILSLLVACQSQPPASSEQTYQVSDTVTTARLVGEGVISSPAPEFASTLSPDGRTIYFNRTSDDRSVIRIWTSTFEGGRWKEPTPLTFSDGSYRDIDPFISPDGRRLYFSSTRPLEGSEPKDYDIWFAERSGTEWSEPQNLGTPVNTEMHEIYSSVSTNGNLYFSKFDSAFDSVKVYRSVWARGEFLTPERLVIGLDTMRLTNPAIAPDESFLILVFAYFGEANLLVSHRLTDTMWSEPQPLTHAANSPFTDFAPAVTVDGKTLFFTSERPGVVPEGVVEGRPPGDIYALPVRSALP